MAKVAFPERCAVAVVCGEHVISQVYPASVPVEAFIDSVIELLSDDLRRRGSDGLDTTTGYELHRANGMRLDITKTLDDLGVEDGATLVLSVAQDGDSFEPQYESLSTGLARISKRLFSPVTATTALQTALGIVAMTVLTTAALGVYTRMASDTRMTALITGLIGVSLMVGAISVWRWWSSRLDLIGALGWLATPVFAVCFASAAPGRLGAAHLFIGLLTTAAGSVVMISITGQNRMAGTVVVTLSAFGALVTAARMAAAVQWQWLGMSVMVGLLLLLTAAPTLALWAARIRPPHFGSITGRDLFRRNDGMPIDAVTPVEDEPDDHSESDSTPRGEFIAAAAKRANSVLTGICIAASIVLPMAAFMTIAPGHPRAGAAGALMFLFVLIFISRARSFSHAWQATPLVLGALAAVCTTVTRYVLASGGKPSGFFFGACVLVLFGSAGLAAALLVPGTRFTPLVRMTVEWLELLAIVAALPLAAWIGGLFTWVRMR